MTLRATITAARELYASAPSHTPAYGYVPHGQHCIVTALSEAGGDWEATAFFRRNAGVPSLAQYNEEHSTEDVLALFDHVLEQL